MTLMDIPRATIEALESSVRARVRFHVILEIFCLCVLAATLGACKQVASVLAPVLDEFVVLLERLAANLACRVVAPHHVRSESLETWERRLT